MKKGVLLFFTALAFEVCVVAKIKAQTTAYYGHGRVLKHTPEVPDIGNFEVNTLALQYGRFSDTAKHWARVHGQPKYGFTVFFNQYGARALDKSFALIPYLGREVKLGQSPFSFNYHFGLGLGFFTRYYDSLTNPLNENISTPLNIAVDLRFGLQYVLNAHFSLSAQSSLLHYSNGAYKLPNYGLNVGQFLLGLQYQWQPVKAHRLVKPSLKTRQEWLVMLHLGLRQSPINRQYNPVQSLNMERNWLLNGRHRLGGGLALFNDATHKEYEAWATIWSDGTYPTYQWHQTLNAGVYLNFETVLQNFSYYIHTGVYVLGAYRNFEATNDYLGTGTPFVHRVQLNRSYFFNRFGFRYRFASHLVANLSLKSHLFKAQYLELGLGTYF
jgi:hypothetical protein